MRILWFTTSSSLFDKGIHKYHGTGWVESLETLVASLEDVELGITFPHKSKGQKSVIDNTTYYPVKKERARKNPCRAFFMNWSGNIDEEFSKKKYLEIINDFKPDLIHIFGTENEYARVQKFTNKPVIIHLQGLVNPLVNSYFPANHSRINFLWSTSYLFKNLLGKSPYFTFSKYRKIARRERDFLNAAQFISGRTKWDKLLSLSYNQNRNYFHINEVLRPIFYEIKPKTDSQEIQILQIISTLSPTVYKGLDVVLKTARHLKKLSNIKFEWKIIGLDKNAKLLKYFEKAENINHQDVNIICCGKCDSKNVARFLVQSDVYVHPSYIDNSPNSLCEAQIIGLPVIACNVGGVSSLITHEETGFLVPSNGVFEIVNYLKTIKEDVSLRNQIAHRARQLALERHNRSKIVADLRQMYNSVLDIPLLQK